MSEIEFYYNGNNIKIQCNKYEKIKEIFNKFVAKIGANQNSFVYIYNGNIITNEELTFDQLSNVDDKRRNKMNILVSQSSFTNFSQFIYEECNVKDNEMKDFAEMVILHALQKYPENDREKCLFVQDKFEGKYGDLWGASFIKNGDAINRYFDYFIKVRYAGYTIRIMRTRDD